MLNLNHQDDVHVDRLGALASGFCVGALSYLVSTASDDKVNGYHYAKLFLFAVLSYLIVSWLLERCWTGSLKRVIPRWILIAILGSLLHEALVTASTVANAWTHPQTVWPSWNEFISSEIADTKLFVVFFSILTLPVMATFHYAGSIVKAVRRWHNGSEEPPSLLGKRRT